MRGGVCGRALAIAGGVGRARCAQALEPPRRLPAASHRRRGRRRSHRTLPTRGAERNGPRAGAGSCNGRHHASGGGTPHGRVLFIALNVIAGVIVVPVVRCPHGLDSASFPSRSGRQHRRRGRGGERGPAVGSPPARRGPLLSASATAGRRKASGLGPRPLRRRERDKMAHSETVRDGRGGAGGSARRVQVAIVGCAHQARDRRCAAHGNGPGMDAYPAAKRGVFCGAGAAALALQGGAQRFDGRSSLAYRANRRPHGNHVCQKGLQRSLPTLGPAAVGGGVLRRSLHRQRGAEEKGRGRMRERHARRRRAATEKKKRRGMYVAGASTADRTATFSSPRAKQGPARSSMHSNTMLRLRTATSRKEAAGMESATQGRAGVYGSAETHSALLTDQHRSPAHRRTHEAPRHRRYCARGW